MSVFESTRHAGLWTLAVKLGGLFSACGGPLALHDAWKGELGSDVAFAVMFAPVVLILFGSFSLRSEERDAFGRLSVASGVLGAALLVLMNGYGVWAVWSGRHPHDGGLILLGIVVGFAVLAWYATAAMRYYQNQEGNERAPELAVESAPESSNAITSGELVPTSREARGLGDVEASPLRLAYRPRPLPLLLAVVLFGAAGAFFVHRAQTNDRGLILNRILTLEVDGASYFYWLFAVLSFGFVLMGVLGLLQRAQKVRYLVVDEQGVEVPLRWRRESRRLRYDEILSMTHREINGQRFLQLNTAEKPVTIAAIQLASNTEFERVVERITLQFDDHKPALATRSRNEL